MDGWSLCIEFSGSMVGVTMESRCLQRLYMP